MTSWQRPWSETRPAIRTPETESRPRSETPPRVELGTPRRILFVNQYYWPDPVSTAQHLADLAEWLAAEGHDVHVLCSRGGSRPDLPRRPRTERHNGVTIHRVGATALGRRSTLTRLADYLSFAQSALRRAVGLPRFDVVVTLTTPPLVGLLGSVLQKLKGSLHVYWSMDLHPDASLALGRMSPRNPVVRALAWLSDSVHRRADQVVVLGPYMQDRVLQKGVRPGRVATIPVWSRADEITPLPRAGHPLRETLGLGDRLVAMYSGNLGLAHGFDDFLTAARAFRKRDDLVFLFVGTGPRRASIEMAIRDEGLANVRLLDPVPREQLGDLLTLADLHLISMRSEMVGIVVPSKLYGAMAAGRPSLFVGPVHCEPADLIRQAEAGWTARQGEPAEVIAAMEQFLADPAEARLKGERGFEAFLERYERAACCESWSDLLAGLMPAADALASPVRPSVGVASPHLPRRRLRVPSRTASAARIHVS